MYALVGSQPVHTRSHSHEIGASGAYSHAARCHPVFHCALGWNRTSGLRFRKPSLYPLSYEGAGAKLPPTEWGAGAPERTQVAVRAVERVEV